MNVLVIGGTGYIGRHNAEELARRGHDVSVLARGRTQARLPQGVALIEGDRHDAKLLDRVQALRFDAVIDLIAYTREETLTLINLFDGALSRFVHLSTFSVCQRASMLPFTEND